jgi:tRNA G10  N-methylase Trm11
MVVDENTRLLDPTCGSGSALRAADRMGAASVLGLEVNPEFASNARRAWERRNG